MDERAIKAELQAIKQRNGLTLTSLRDRHELIEALGLDSPEALYQVLVLHLDKLSGTREGAALRNAYGIDRDEPGISLAGRRRLLADAWQVSIDTVKRDEARGVNQLYLWLFPPDAFAARDDTWSILTAPIEINFGSKVSPDTHFRAQGVELIIHGADRSWFEVPEVALWFDEELIESDRCFTFFYLRPNDVRPEATLQFQLGDQSVLVNFKLREFHGADLSTVRLTLHGPARPSTVVHSQIPDPNEFDESLIRSLTSEHGVTNGSWIALLYDDRPTISRVFVLRDFVEQWEEPQRSDFIRTGALLPLFATGSGSNDDADG